MVAHEYAHGYAALKQGDNTAQMLGRLTWNPLKHIDPVMTIIMPLITYFTMGVAFGGAKPVPVNPRLYRNYKRGDIIVSLAGIVTNLILAVLLVLAVALLGKIYHVVPVLGNTLALLQEMFVYGIIVNLVLAVFNLIPIPPLDGSHVMKHLLPAKWSLAYQRIAPYGFFILIVLLSFGRRALDLWMSPIFTVFQSVQRHLAPYMIPIQWTT
jgi:Zn-dependent protease